MGKWLMISNPFQDSIHLEQRVLNRLRVREEYG